VAREIGASGRDNKPVIFERAGGDQPIVADQNLVSAQKHVREGISFVMERHFRRTHVTSETNIGPMSPAVETNELLRVVKIRGTSCKRGSAHRHGTDNNRAS
jgi:hypothetical protein